VTPAQAEASRRIRSWRENPKQFAHDVFGVTLDKWQERALDAVGGPTNPRRRLMMKACTGPGKSAVLAIIGWHRLACFAEKGDHPKGAALSGEGRDNLRDNLWSELAKWRNRSEFLTRTFEWTKERIFARDHAETWFLSARSYPRDANPDAVGRSLSGLHSGFPFLLLDETGNMPVQVGQKATQIFTGGTIDGLIAGAGNPTSTGHLLYHVATHQRDVWVVITITADPDDAERTPRVDIGHAREQIALYGRDNPWIMATILGMFPAGGVNTLMGPDDIEAAMTRTLPEDAYSWAQKRLGVDVARFGDDRSVIFPRQGLMAFRPEIMRKQDTTQIAAAVVNKKLEWKSDREFVDDSGHWGHGVLDNVKAGGFKPTAVLFEDTPYQDQTCKNRRAEMWIALSKWVKGNGVLPKMPELVKELAAPTYSFVQGKFLLEPKDLIKKRLGYSPDLGDGLALTFAEPDVPREFRPKQAPRPSRSGGGGHGWMG
jgi:phage terminase large subunit